MKNFQNVVVNWNKVFADDESSVVDFAYGNLSFRDFYRLFSCPDTRKEIAKLQLREPKQRRVLAKKACYRRHL